MVCVVCVCFGEGEGVSILLDRDHAFLLCIYAWVSILLDRVHGSELHGDTLLRLGAAAEMDEAGIFRDP